MLIALVSAKGAPGVTTTALALAAVAPNPRLVVEMDPSGGDLELFTRSHGVEGLARVAASLRHGTDLDGVRGAVTEIAGGVPAILAELGGPPTEAALVSAGDRLGPALADLGGVVAADVGRWSPAQRTAGRIRGADVVGVVCQANPSSVQHARWLVEVLRAQQPAPVMVVLVGERPYRVDEVRPLFPVAVTRPLALDAAGVATMYAGVGTRRFRFSMLARTAPQVLDELMARAGEVAGVA